MNKFLYKVLIFFMAFVLSKTSISYCDDFIEEIEPNIKDEIIEASTTAVNNSDYLTLEKIKEPQINSCSAVVIDRNTNTILYGKNENQKRKMASTTKIMTATVIIENCNLSDIVTISKKAASTGGSRLGLKTGDKIIVNDLLYGLLLKSGNDAAVALAEYCSGSISNFADMMNKKAFELGLHNTHFETPHGLDSNEHYTTAYELALLSNYAMQNKTFRTIVGTKTTTININNISRQISNTNELLGNFDGVYGIKTGFTNGANRCLVTACKRQNMDIICVVLGADTKKFRTQDSVKLLNYAFNNFESVSIENIVNSNFEKWKAENLSKIVINKADSSLINSKLSEKNNNYNNLNLRIEEIENKIIPIRKDLVNSIKINVNCPLYFEAPIEKDSNLGTIDVYIENKEIFEYSIYSNNEIKRKSWNDYFLDLIKKYSTSLNANLNF